MGCLQAKGTLNVVTKISDEPTTPKHIRHHTYPKNSHDKHQSSQYSKHRSSKGHHLEQISKFARKATLNLGNSPLWIKNGAKRHTLVAISESKDHFLNNFTLVKKVGSGAFGEIFHAISNADATQEFAIKLIDKSKLTPQKMSEVKNEAGVLIELSHPNIVDYHSHHTDENFLYLVMEYCPNGQLLDSYKFDEDNLNERELAAIMNDLFGALKHLQAVKIVHRDIKPENIMWGDDGKIRLTDFGTAI